MDINTLRALAVILCMVAFFGIVFWAYSTKQKRAFDEAANLPFADEPTSRFAGKTMFEVGDEKKMEGKQNV